MNLNQKVVVVTGAGRGLGRGIATYFAGKGARLACVDLSQEDLNATVAACEAAGGEARAYLANVAKEEEVEKLFSDVVADFGSLHGLVNNAGITRDGLLVKYKDGEVVSKMSLQQWQAVIDAAAKTGVVALAEVWAKELARYNIRTGAVAPGTINTDMLAAMKPEARERLIQAVPLRRLGEAEHIARSVAFIFETDYFTGRCIDMDGGLR